MNIPERVVVEVDLRVEHSGHTLALKGIGPEYSARFSSLFSALHFALALWPMRKLAPEGLTVRLECGSLHYRYRT